MRHTPGPWFAAADDASDCKIHRNSGLARVDTGRESDWPIARLCEWNNVPLIAAAPDLLEALRSIADQEQHDGDTETHMHDMADIARAAIAKAEGK